jgi:hypothetical protein
MFKRISYFKPFSAYKSDAHNWITLANGEYYPDVLKDACELYKPVLILFGKLLKSSETSKRLFLSISEVGNGWMRIQLARVFRKYVSPETPVEMLKKKTMAHDICDQFGGKFDKRPVPDEALCALLWEYKDRGKKGYDLTERFFELVKSYFPDLEITGPIRAGRDILMKDVFSDYPNPTRPVDFVIKKNEKILAIGLARYDSDRGGAQEDDRTGGYTNCANEILGYTNKKNLSTKVIFINDGPGLLLGSMWNDYTKLEEGGRGKIMVSTLRMLSERLNIDWLSN